MILSVIRMHEEAFFKWTSSVAHSVIECKPSFLSGKMRQQIMNYCSISLDPSIDLCALPCIPDGVSSSCAITYSWPHRAASPSRLQELGAILALSSSPLVAFIFYGPATDGGVMLFYGHYRILREPKMTWLAYNRETARSCVQLDDSSRYIFEWHRHIGDEDN